MKKLLNEFISKNEEQTYEFAKELALKIEVPTVINLVGDLGAGKTTFTKGFLKALGVKENVTSPTFTLLNEYQTGYPIYHFDMYRIEDPNETEQLGFDEYFDLNFLNGITLVEWASNTPHLLPSKYLQITIEKITDNQRKFVIELIQN